jgi:hypothetical protein
MLKYIGIFFKSVWSDWLARITGGLSVPFTILSFFDFSPTTKYLFIITAITGLVVTVFRLWVKEYQIAHRNALQFRLTPKTSTTEALSRIALEAPDRSRLSAGIAVRFENSDTARLYVSGFQLSVCEKLRFGRYRTIITRRAFTVQSETVVRGREWLERGIPVEGREVSVPYSLMFAFDLPGNLSDRLGSAHFVRLTMSAMKQSDEHLDYTVDWNAARTETGAIIGPPAE